MKTFKFLLAAAVLAAAIAAAALAPAVWAADDACVMLDGAYLAFDEPPRVVGGRTMVPMRVIFEAMGAGVDWDGASRTVTSRKGGTTVQLVVGRTAAYKDGALIALDAAPVVAGDRTLVPLRFIAESFGADVNWDAVNSIAVITTPNVNPAAAPEIGIIGDIAGAAFTESSPGVYVGYVQALDVQYVTESFVNALVERGFALDEAASEQRRATVMTGAGKTVVVEPGAPYVVTIEPQS
ncbi:MAG: copper amine oxidase N-terminal domain-containing protein [Peptococcaceae bacterium]|jgi:hypothetical protein|nr:copper amine oxidase N-terminal domain-containing protein [Peptococcaceae bacterium]